MDIMNDNLQHISLIMLVRQPIEAEYKESTANSLGLVECVHHLPNGQVKFL